ncbi:hypothetical protein BD779DRAFT_48900 [Infundibulicybe gibba]|nr:hypothetical protein BD779DRAFT_48900 [Infundibulicybe gibba]
MFESNRTKAPQLDKIDELDETNPLGLSLHHGGPYEALRHLTFQGPPKRAVPYNVGSQYAATSDKHQNHTSTNIQRESDIQSEAPQKPMRSPPRPSQHHIDKPTRVASDERQRRMSSDVRPPVVPENSQKLLQAPPHGHIPIGAPLSISPGQILPPNFQPYSQMHLAQWSSELSRYPSPQNAPSPSDMGNQPALHYHQHGQYQRENTLPDSHHSMQQQHNLQQEHYPADQLPPALAQSTTASHASPSDPRRPRHYSMPTRNLVPPAYPTIPPPSSHDGAPSSSPLVHEPRDVETHIPRRASLVVSVTDEHMPQATQNTSPQPQPSQDGQARPSIGSSGLLPARSRPIRDGSPPNVNRQVTPNGHIVQEQQRSKYGYNAPGEQRPPLGYHNSQVRSLASRPDPSRIPQTSLPLTYPPPMEQPEYDGVANASDTQGAKEMNSAIQTTPPYPQNLQPQRHPSRDTQSIQQSVTSSSNSSNSNRPRHQSRFAPKRLIMPAPLQSSVSVNTGSSLMHPGPQIQPRPHHDLYRNYPPQTGPHPQFRQPQAPPQIRGALPPSRTPSLHNQPATQAKDVRMIPQARKLQKRASIATPSDTSSVISPKTPLSFAPTPSYPQAYAPPLAHSKSDKAPKRVLSKRRNDM